MKLKMPGPNGIITLVSDPDIALHAENKTASLALEALSEALAAEELTTLRSTVNRDDVILDKRPKSTSFKPAEGIVKFRLHPTDPKKTTSIGAQLDPAVDTSILHHAFISIFIALWAVITHYDTILMPILSYFTRFT